MKRVKVKRRYQVAAVAVAVAAAVAAATLTLLSGSASATPNHGVVEVTADVDVCGEVTLTFTNSTPWTFSADVRRPGETGTPDRYSTIVAEEGPLVGQPLGNRYNPVTVALDTTVTTVLFTEDEDVASIDYRVARGPEQKLFLDWVAVTDFKTDCQPPPPPTTTTTTTPPITTTTPPVTTTTSATTTTTSSVPPKNTTDRPTSSRPMTVHPTNVHTVRTSTTHDVAGIGTTGSSGRLPDTGVSGTVRLLWFGGLLILAGGALVGLVLIRRRATSQPDARR